MPNWNQNYLSVYGSEKDVADFKKKVKSKNCVFDFEKIYPTPKELLNTQAPNRNKILAEKFKEKHGAEDWYTWRLKNWGTKWKIDEQGIDWDGNNLMFDTAYSPPMGIICKIATLFPHLIFSLQYSEPGLCFSGIIVIKNNIALGEEDGSMMYEGSTKKASDMLDRKIEQYITGLKLVEKCKTSYDVSEICSVLKKIRDDKVKKNIIAYIMKYTTQEQLSELTNEYPQLIEFIITKGL